MAKEKTEEQEAQAPSLETFDWDESGSGDFFGIKDTAVAPETPPAPPAEAAKAKVKTKAKAEEAKVEEETEEGEEPEDNTSFFDVPVEGVVEGEQEEGEEEEAEDFGDYKSLTNKMKEKGIFQNIEISEEDDIDEDKFIELQDEEIESRVEEALEGFMEQLDGDAKNFLKFKKEGGKTEDFFKVYSSSSGLPDGDITNESFQEKISRYYYGNVEKLDAEDIDDRIEWLRDSNKLEKYAEKQYDKLKEMETKSKEEIQKKAEAEQKLQVAERKAFVDTVQETLDSTSEIENFKFNPKLKQQLHAFITKPSVKVSKNRYVTQMQSKLQESLKDPKKMIVLANILMTDFDFSNVVAATTTKTTKNLKQEMQRSKTVRPTGSNKTRPNRNLADFF